MLQFLSSSHRRAALCSVPSSSKDQTCTRHPVSNRTHQSAQLTSTTCWASPSPSPTEPPPQDKKSPGQREVCHRRLRQSCAQSRRPGQAGPIIHGKDGDAAHWQHRGMQRTASWPRIGELEVLSTIVQGFGNI
ncbi:hypothetical protein DUNSADRAFT_16415 [Dunaliella salina]|uniref:Encoded protein n=1 Tax=Dunaliella salina TaxID=3046 RepID=A0ABQ7G3L5_DUNSA|nr:hypothetical protein DUNSADRAFT_16415 [Dunaliella salina]|eukprot:KAF5829193.1 hypothetical protein DUNSADRAFT_16415 [Dunaliella salina]